MASDGEDEDLARAIALSLGKMEDFITADRPAVSDNVIDLSTESEDDDDLDKPAGGHRPPRESVQQSQVTHSQAEIVHEQRDIPGLSCTTGTQGLGILQTMNRRQMEAERLERTMKRKRPLSPPSSRAPQSTCDAARPVKRQATELDLESSKMPPSSVISDRQPHEPPLPGLQYPKGVVKKTWAYGYPRQDDIKIEEVLQKSDLELAVLSSFQWDEQWIMSKLNLAKTKVVCVVQAKSEAEKGLMRSNVPANIKFCFPSMEGNINCMHSKLMLLSHPQNIRIVVPSANLVPYDWGEAGGVMENMVFLIDLPRLKTKRSVPCERQTPFERELRRFLSAQGLESSIIDSLSNFDFSATKPLAFVHSIGGPHLSGQWKRTGYCGLGAAVKELGLSSSHLAAVDFISASIGSLKEEFIMDIFLAASGDDGLEGYNRRYSQTSNPMASTSNDRLEHIQGEVNRKFRIYFPTHDTVAKSKGGIASGGTICFQPQWYDAATFPRSLLRDCKSNRDGLLMHNKIIFVRLVHPIPVGVDVSGSAQEIVAWAYVGSANLSESAWGRLVKDRTTKQPKLNLRNWECGVIIPVRKATSPDTVPIIDSQSSEVESSMAAVGKKGSRSASLDVFQGTVPLPMQFPGDLYVDRRPWFYNQRA